MNIRPISEWTFYKHRFFIAYTLLGILTILLLTAYPSALPPGLSKAEEASIVTAHSIQFTQPPSPSQIIDLPFHLLQKLSVEFLGVTPLGVRLPSLVLATVTALCISLIIKRWFKTNVAIVASAIAVTSCWFLALGRNGTPDIMIPFWTSLLILAATYVSQQTKRWYIWKALFGLSAALSLYTPYMTYLFIATLLAALAQPHLRYLIRQSSKVGLTIGTFFFILLLAPLGWGIYKDLGIVASVLAFPGSLPEPLQFGQSLVQAISNFANPLNVHASATILPLVSLSTLAIIIIGGIRLLSDFHSVRAYVLLIWSALLIPIVGLNPNNLTVLFVPSMLVMAIGLNLIVRYWYRMFPFNPYARIFGLLPLFLLIGSIMQFNYQRYTYTMLYNPDVGTTFKNDAFLAQAEVANATANTPVTLVVSDAERPLYAVIAERRQNTQVITASQIGTRPGKYIVAENQQNNAAALSESVPTSLLVNDHQHDALRFRVYVR